jgi:Tfp pilus assembly protein PilX
MNQRGIALLAGLVLLASISLLALMAASGMIMQKQLASNFRQDMKALENSGIATSYASSWLYSRPKHERDAGCSSDCVLPVAIRSVSEIPAAAEYESAAWWRDNGVEAGTNPATGEKIVSYEDSGSEPPRWIIEELHYQSLAGSGFEDGTEGLAYYRILGRGAGVHPASIAVTESIVARPWGGDYQLNEFPPGHMLTDFCAQFDDPTIPPFNCGPLTWRQRR